MQRIVFIVFLVIVGASVLFAQTPYRNSPQSSTREFIDNSYTSIPYTGLLDASRLSMGHQIGMNYSSIGGSGLSQGYYLNTLSYQFRAPVSLRLRTGVTNNPYSSGSSYDLNSSPIGNMLENAEFFGGADLDWRPKDNMLFRLSIDKMPAGMYYNNPYASRYWMGDYGSWGMGMYGHHGASGYRSNHEREVFDSP
ncbi:MAG: hypothetical protein P9L92_04475 [Candidatus Electryonea clarkiae]|nr:hypothetical protein [Candidatus Electryonea clarkiae]MDP8288665.1 hypothetical protein [Candidatus Electryonea clarkiae]